MNRFENWFCASSLWRTVTRKQLLPWLLSGVELGDHVLEIGAGPGAATEDLRKRAARVTSLEYSHDFAVHLARRDNRENRTNAEHKNDATNGAVLQGDTSTLPFPDKTFSSAVAILVLHHLRSQELQERAFSEIHRVLRPGGIFFAIEIQDGWLIRTMHIRSTFVPVAAASVSARLNATGFSRVDIAFRRGRRGPYCLTALRPRESGNS